MEELSSKMLAQMLNNEERDDLVRKFLKTQGWGTPHFDGTDAAQSPKQVQELMGHINFGQFFNCTHHHSLGARFYFQDKVASTYPTVVQNACIMLCCDSMEKSVALNLKEAKVHRHGPIFPN